MDVKECLKLIREGHQLNESWFKNKTTPPDEFYNSIQKIVNQISQKINGEKAYKPHSDIKNFNIEDIKQKKKSKVRLNFADNTEYMSNLPAEKQHEQHSSFIQKIKSAIKGIGFKINDDSGTHIEMVNNDNTIEIVINYEDIPHTIYISYIGKNG